MPEATGARRFAVPARGVGAVIAAAIAAVLGFVSVPNSVVPGSDIADHLRSVLAACLASVPPATVLARRAAERPGQAGVLLSVSTVVLGPLGLLVAGARVTAWNVVGPNPTDPFALLAGLPFLPWIVAGSVLWVAAVRAAERIAGGAPDALDAPTRGHPGVRSLAIGVLLVIVAGWVFGSPIRHLGSALPPVPASRQPDVAGIVASENADGVIALETGATVDARTSVQRGGPSAIPSGSLVLAGPHDPVFPENGWYAVLLRDPPAPGAGAGCWLPSSDEAGRFAWDRGSTVLFETGLLLPKASSFSSQGREVMTVDGTVYLQASLSFCVNERGELARYDGVDYGG